MIGYGHGDDDTWTAITASGVTMNGRIIRQGRRDFVAIEAVTMARRRATTRIAAIRGVILAAEHTKALPDTYLGPHPGGRGIHPARA